MMTPTIEDVHEDGHVDILWLVVNDEITNFGVEYCDLGFTTI